MPSFDAAVSEKASAQKLGSAWRFNGIARRFWLNLSTETCWLLTKPIQRLSITIRRPQHRRSTLHRRQSIGGSIAMPPKTKCMAKLVQSRGLKRLRTQFGRHQHRDAWLQSPHILATHLQDLKQRTTVTSSPLASDVTQRWSPALHAHMRLTRILDPRDRQQR